MTTYRYTRDADFSESPEAFLIRAGIQYKRHGTRAVFPCPTCNETEGCDINLKTGFWNCLRASCGGGGGNLHQLKERLGMAYAVPSKIQSEMFGADKRSAPAPKAQTFRAKIGSSHHSWRRRLLESPYASHARDYLAARHLSTEVAEHACIGWLPSDQGSDLIGQGLLTIPYCEADQPPHNVKLRWVPPEPHEGRRYQKIKGGQSTLYAPAALDPAYPLLIVGGEIDCLSVLSVTGLRPTETIGVNVVSLPDGEGSWRERYTQDVERYERIYWALDADAAGVEAQERHSKAVGRQRSLLCQGWPDRAKDANEALCRGMLSIESIQAMLNSAESPAKDGLIRPSSRYESVLSLLTDPVRVQGWSTPWAPLNKMIKGLRPGEVTCMTGHTGCGKTTFSFQLAQHMMFAHDLPTMICPFEGGVDPALALITGQHQGVDMFDPAVSGRAGMLMQSLASFDERLFLLNKDGTIEPDAFLETLSYSVHQLGIRFVVVDNLQFMLEMFDENQFNIQDKLVMGIQMIIQQSQAHLLLLCHPVKNPDRRRKDRDNYIVTLNDLYGKASTFQRLANAWSVFRPRSAMRDQELHRLPDGRYQAALMVLKQRHPKASEGLLEMAYDKETSRFDVLGVSSEESWTESKGLMFS